MADKPGLEGVIAAAAKQAPGRGLPPVHLWHPEHCGEIDIRIRKDGVWFHEGTPIGREALVRLFSTVLRKDPDGFHLVTPVVGFVREGFTLTANPEEVADIFETPFGFLMDPKNYEEHERELPTGETRRFYAMTHEDQYIWGATAGMLRALYDRLYGAALA